MEDRVRRKSIELLQQALNSNDQDLAQEIESELFRASDSQVNGTYKDAVRSHIMNLKDPANPLLREKVLSGDIAPNMFAQMSSADMAAPERRLEDEQLRRKSILESINHDHIQPRHREDDGNPDEMR